MKKQLSIFIKLLFFALHVPCVLLVLFSLSNCEGSGDQFPSFEEEEEAAATTTQQTTVVSAPTCASVFYYEDWDNDGYGNPLVSADSCTQPDGYVTDNTDCDDDMYYVNPGMDGMDDSSGGQSEVFADYLFEEIDNDCDTEIDEDTQLMQYTAPDFSLPQGYIVLPAP